MTEAWAYFERAYTEILKPGLIFRRDQMDHAQRPVMVSLLNAYLERMEVFYRAGEVGADEVLITEIDELAPWVNPSREISADTAHSAPLGEMMVDAGCEYPEVYEIIEQARKRNRGRPVNLDAIEALEMNLTGKGNVEIADALCHCHLMPQGHEQGSSCVERIRKEIETAGALYEKYKPRK